MYLFLVYYINTFIVDFFLSTTYQPWYTFIASLVNVYDNSLFVILLTSFFTRLCPLINWLFVHSIYDLTSYTIKSSIPPQLSIGYNSIHPVLFYISFIIISSIYFNNIFFFKIKTFWVIGAIALLLGGLWGLGNSVWGFFWVNDRIELILLFHTMHLLILLHIYWQQYIYKYIYQVTWCLIIFILFARWNFLFTRHSFFNLTNLTNIAIVYIYIYYPFNIKAIIKLLAACYTSFLFWLNFFAYCIFYQIKRLSYYTTFLILLHTIIFVLFLSWLKYREHNLIFLVTYQYTYIHYIYLSNNFNFVTNTFFSYNFTKLLIFKLTIYTGYPFKLVNSVYLIYCSYPTICSLILLLISILKIYVS